MPDVSVLRRENGRTLRVSDAPLSPGDDFCSVWHLFDLMPQGAAGWQPKYTYGEWFRVRAAIPASTGAASRLATAQHLRQYFFDRMG